MITTLPDEIRKQFPKIVKDAIADGLRCEPAERDRAEKALRKIYKLAGLNEQVTIIWVESPIVGSLAAPMAANVIEILKNKKGSAVHSAVSSAVSSAVDSAVDSAVVSAVGSAVHSAVSSAVGSAVHSAVHSAVGSDVSSAVSSAVGSAVYSAVYSDVSSAVGSDVRSAVDSAVYSAVVSAVSSAVGSAVHSAVSSAVGSDVRSAVRSAVYSAVGSAVDSAVSSAVKKQKLWWHYYRGGQFWIYWSAFVETIMKLGVDHKSFEAIRAEAEVCRSAGWYWPNKDFIMICERPKCIIKDDNGRLHCENGPAIDYGPTFKLYSWHGTTIPENWITNKESLTPEIALKTTNVEQRRAACEILGWHHILNKLNSKIINDDGDPEIGQLVEVEIPDIGKERFLRVKCGTGREFALPVPPTMKTALEAQSWTWGLDTKTFIKPEVRT